MAENQSLSDLLADPHISRRDKVLLLLAAKEGTPKSVSGIIQDASSHGAPEVRNWNVSDVLRRSKEFAIRLPTGWSLTSKGRKRVAAKGFGGGAVTPAGSAATELRKLLHTVTDKEATAFLEEAVACLENRLYRAAVVLSWSGAIWLLYKEVEAKHLVDFNAEARKRDTKWRNARTADDLGIIKENTFLEILHSIGVLQKNAKDELQNNCLKLRNACGHPNTFKFGDNRVAAHIEVLILNVFQRFA